MMKKCLMILVLAWMPALSYAQTGYAVLDDFFSNVQGFQAEFSQIVYDEHFNEIQNSTGQMALSRPNQFSWTYEQPYEQLIVGDGKEVWIYDIDLEQVTVKPQSDTLGETPAQLLSSSKPLVDEFSVRELGERSGQMWYELRPLSAENSFEAIRLGFKAQAMVKMELQDNLGNRTIFDFSDVELNPAFDKQQFSFVPPEGVDVIGRE